MKVKVGSDAHKELFCRQFLETHELYDPAALPWPDLDEAQLGRLRSVPFWQEVYHTERRAGAIVAARGGRLGLNSVSLSISGTSAGCLGELPLVGVAQGGRSPTGAMPTNGGEIHAAATSGRPSK